MFDFKAVIFDLDGTVLDSMGVWRKVDEIFLARRGMTIPDDYMDTVSVMTLDEAADYSIERFSLKGTREEIVGEWSELAYNEYHNNIKLKDGVREYMKKLRRKGIKFALATASSPSLFRRALEREGVYEYFDVLAHPETGHRKGSPDIYRHCAHALGVKPADCVVFEDIFEGIRAAKEAGMRTVAVLDENSYRQHERMREIADMAIVSFREML